jgi:hypothetical protein
MSSCRFSWSLFGNKLPGLPTIGKLYVNDNLQHLDEEIIGATAEFEHNEGDVEEEEEDDEEEEEEGEIYRLN